MILYTSIQFINQNSANHKLFSPLTLMLHDILGGNANINTLDALIAHMNKI